MLIKPKFLGAVAGLLSIAILSALAKAGPADDAKTLYKNYLGPHVGSKDKVNRNLSAPLVRGTQITSPSGHTKFDAKSLQASGQPLMRVSAFLNMPTGDLTGITVEQDLDFNGSLETATVFPQNASGRLIAAVCSNGYVQCSPGTYANCQYRKWQAEANGRLGVAVAGAIESGATQGVVNALSGCFCFNNHCSKQNNSAIINLSGIVSDVAGGIAGAVLDARKDLAITSIQSSNLGTVTYYGIKTDSTTGGKTSLMSAEQAAAMPTLPSTDIVQIQNLYKDSPHTIAAAGESVKQSQTGDPKSLFSKVSGALEQQASQTISCTNQRGSSLQLKTYTQTIEEGLGGGGKKLCTDHYLRTILSRDAQGRFAIGWRDVGANGIYGMNCGTVPFNETLGTQGYLAGIVTVTPPPESAGYKITTASAYMNVWGDGCSSGDGSLVWHEGLAVPLVGSTGAICYGDGAQRPYYSFRLVVEYQSQDLVEEETMGCQQYENNPDCRLQQDLWDGRPVHLNFMPTGFQMYQICKDMAGPVRSTRQCRDWWKQERVYICKNDAAYDFSGIQQRAKEIQNSARMPTDTTLACSDKGSALNFQVPPKDGDTACQQVCKTKAPLRASVVTTVGPRSEKQMDSATEKDNWKIFYKECESTPSGTFACPVDTSIGEVVVTNCMCGTEFGEAFGALSAINRAAKDTVCSEK